MQLSKIRYGVNGSIDDWKKHIEQMKHIRDNRGRDEHYWSNMLDAPARKTSAGNMFEQVCKDHISQIKQKIGILGILSSESSWFVRADRGHTKAKRAPLGRES